MSIFPRINAPDTVQQNDKFRIDASGSFLTPDENDITLIRIQPSAAESFLTVFQTGDNLRNSFLDFVYPIAGASTTETISVEVTTDGAPVVLTKTISVLTEADDLLFSDDSDIKLVEPEIYDFLPQGRSSFLNIHRKAQTQIMDFFDERGIKRLDKTRLQKTDIFDKEEVRAWSTYLVLHYIFQAQSNAPDDIFKEKSDTYQDMAYRHRDRQVQIDLNQDGEVNEAEKPAPFSMRLGRR